MTTVSQVSRLDVHLRTVSAHHALILDDPAFVWLVRSGGAEVFTSQAEAGRPVGRRRFLFRARVNDLVFAFGSDAGNNGRTRLALIATEELTLLQIPVDRLDLVLQVERVATAAAVEG